MKMKVITLAIAGLASSLAIAQTNVTIYGIADAGFLYLNNGVGQDYYGVGSGLMAGSRLGFRGSEDLGNGTKAVFVLEQGFSIDTGDASASPTGGSSSFQRQAFVGIDSKAGALTFGRQYAPGYVHAVGHEASLLTLLSPHHMLSSYAGATIAPNSNARWNNTVKYVTPKMGGLEGQIIYRFGEQLNNTDRAEGYGAGLKYAGGPLSVAYVFHHTESSVQGAVATNGGSQNEHALFGSIDLNLVKFVATYQIQDWDRAPTSGGRANASSSQIATLGAMVPVGKGKINLATGYMDLNAANGSQGASGSGVSHLLAYTHGLSKRTTLYTGLNYTDLSFRARTDNYVSGSPLIGGVNGGATANAANAHFLSSGVQVFGGDSISFTAGINHVF